MRIRNAQFVFADNCLFNEFMHLCNIKYKCVSQAVLQAREVSAVPKPLDVPGPSLVPTGISLDSDYSIDSSSPAPGPSSVPTGMSGYSDNSIESSSPGPSQSSSTSLPEVFK